MTLAKRMMDLLVIAVLLPVLLPLTAFSALAILLSDGGPVFYLSERMRTPQKGFILWKLRTMRSNGGGCRIGVTGGDKTAEITPVGQFLRRFRLDELPQAWNVLRGDLSLVGPRPPLRLYVEARPDLYNRVLKCRPGVTGLASLLYHRHEERLLAASGSPEDTHSTYLRRCIPRKGRLDLIYAQNRTVCMDLKILFLTLVAVIGR